MAKTSHTPTERAASLASFIFAGASSRAEVREMAKKYGVYTSEGTFGRDLTRARREFGAGITDRDTNYGGGRKRITINGASVKLRPVPKDKLEPGRMYIRKSGKVYTPVFLGEDRKETREERYRRYLAALESGTLPQRVSYIDDQSSFYEMY